MINKFLAAAIAIITAVALFAGGYAVAASGGNVTITSTFTTTLTTTSTQTVTVTSTATSTSVVETTTTTTAPTVTSTTTVDQLNTTLTSTTGVTTTTTLTSTTTQTVTSTSTSTVTTTPTVTVTTTSMISDSSSTTPGATVLPVFSHTAFAGTDFWLEGEETYPVNTTLSNQTCILEENGLELEHFTYNQVAVGQNFTFGNVTQFAKNPAQEAVWSALNLPEVNIAVLGQQPTACILLFSNETLAQSSHILLGITAGLSIVVGAVMSLLAIRKKRFG